MKKRIIEYNFKIDFKWNYIYTDLKLKILFYSIILNR